MAVNTRQMSYNPAARRFVCDASDIGGVGPQVEVESHLTGTKIVFRCVATEKDNEGDVLCWKYRHDPLNLSLTVFND